jgi:lipoprotein-anchoring transpeptidase ErfK/SrfK
VTTNANRGDGPSPSRREIPTGHVRRRSSHPRVAAAFACLVLVPVLGRPVAASAAATVAPLQPVVGLLAEHAVRSAPGTEGTLVGSVAALRPITHERTVLPVLAESTDRQGRHWLRVRLPGRTLRGKAPPSSGWIRSTHAQLTGTAWHLVVDLGARRLVVYRSGRVVRSFSAIVGKPSTPTPRGRYFVEENVRLLAAAPGAPFALATNARSNVLQEFDGGPGQIAIHGVENLGGGTLGTAISHGCVRVAGSAVTWLAHRIGPGVPITIR